MGLASLQIQNSNTADVDYEVDYEVLLKSVNYIVYLGNQTPYLGIE